MHKASSLFDFDPNNKLDDGKNSTNKSIKK